LIRKKKLAQWEASGIITKFCRMIVQILNNCAIKT